MRMADAMVADMGTMMTSNTKGSGFGRCLFLSCEIISEDADIAIARDVHGAQRLFFLSDLSIYRLRYFPTTDSSADAVRG